MILTLTEDNKTILIGLLSLLSIFWTIFYIIPSFFVSLFSTFLGNIILLIILVLVTSKDKKYGALLFITLIIIYRLINNNNNNNKEGFWSEDSKNKFTELQQLVNPNMVFDLSKVQEQASQEEVDYYVENGMWPWSQDVKDLYMEAINKNTFVRTYSDDSLNQAMKVYNEAIIIQILSWQAKEGQFLLNGVIVKNENNRYEEERDGAGSYGINSGLETNSKSSTLIKCNNSKGVPEIIKYTGDEGILGSHTFDIEEITDFSNLENLIPGFQFTNGTPCNPCLNLKGNDYTCPFSFQNRVSNIWKYLWT